MSATKEANHEKFETAGTQNLTWALLLGFSSPGKTLPEFLFFTNVAIAKWLRDVHGIDITITPRREGEIKQYICVRADKSLGELVSSYEEALDTEVSLVLENLRDKLSREA